MTESVARLLDQVLRLERRDFDEFLAGLVDHSLEDADDWDRQIEQDARPGGRLEGVLDRVRRDIAQGKTKPLDEFLNDA